MMASEFILNSTTLLDSLTMIKTSKTYQQNELVIKLYLTASRLQWNRLLIYGVVADVEERVILMSRRE